MVTGKSGMKLFIFEQNESLIMVRLVCDGQRRFGTIDDVLSGSNQRQQQPPATISWRHGVLHYDTKCSKLHSPSEIHHRGSSTVLEPLKYRCEVVKQHFVGQWSVCRRRFTTPIHSPLMDGLEPVFCWSMVNGWAW